MDPRTFKACTISFDLGPNERDCGAVPRTSVDGRKLFAKCLSLLLLHALPFPVCLSYSMLMTAIVQGDPAHGATVWPSR